MKIFSSGLYETVVWGSAAMAGVVVVIFLLLVLRRYLAERQVDANKRIDAAITRSYLRRVAGHRPETDDAGWTDERRLAAVSQIQALLRGGERDRLMQIAELDGLLAATVRRSRRWRRSERVSAIRLLQRFGSELCIARLRELMARDRSPRVRVEAAFALAAAHALPPPRETMRILRMTDRAPSRLDSALLRASVPDYREQFVLLLEDDLPPVWRAQLIDALGWSGDVAVMPALEKAAGDEDPEVRGAALRASAKLGHPGGREWIMAALRDPDANVRVQAVKASEALGLRDAVPQIRDLREDSQLWVRLRAEQALEALDPGYDTTARPPLARNPAPDLSNCA
ncbi:HEAT repeat domain-containing protein [Citromicrobium bathyomarinum]|uniref:HEAT repeat domain-containing protein n=1 Tax=Citromicrobium bathyomarinum TaxID=72174 RepID=UPI001A464FE9|nr:HEAT repeat domain-containing protein [Citromicrobium sp.]